MFQAATDNELALTFLGWWAVEHQFFLFPALYLAPCQSDDSNCQIEFSDRLCGM